MRPSTIRWICFFAACAASLGGLATLHVQISRVVAEASEPTYVVPRVPNSADREAAQPIVSDDLIPVPYEYASANASAGTIGDGEREAAIANGNDTLAAPLPKPRLTAPSSASDDALDVLD